MRAADRKKRIVILITLAVGISAFFVGTYRALRLPESPESPEPFVPKSQKERAGDEASKARPAPDENRLHLTVTDVQGRAERRGQGGSEWIAVKALDELFADDKLRTDKDAAVRLSINDKSRFELAGRSELSVRALTETVHKIELALGRLSVDYEASQNRMLKIVASDDAQGAVAETSAARFVVQRVNGEVTVAAKMGKVKLTAKAASVIVGPQSFSRVKEGRAPEKPEPIPISVLLKVAKPKRHGGKSTVISGKTNIGAMVYVDDEQADVDESGAFRVTIPLLPEQKRVEVVSQTVWGAAKKQVPILKPSAGAAVTGAKVKWGKARSFKKKKKGAR